MHTKYLQSFALISGFGLLAACPPGTGTTTETASDTTTDTSSSGTDSSPTTSVGPTTNPPTTTETSVGPTTDTTASTTETTGPTTDTSTTSTTGVDGALCEALGGTAGVSELIAGAVAGILADDKINGYFLNSDIDGANLIGCLEKQLGELADCAGVTYDCQDMKTAHAGLGISTNDFMDFAADFTAALDEFQMSHATLADADKETILTAFSGMSADIVEDADSNLTVYQRVGRKPAIKALIGKPGEVDTFVDNVSMDPSISGFFAAADYDRLNTCLTRQVAGIDGPTKYGLEVDAPTGIDPGVGAGNPCKSMADSHAGLQDADMTGISFMDFGALVGHLVTAMTTFGVQQPDQDVVLAALGPLCEDIVEPAAKNDCPSAQKLETVEATMIGGMIMDNGYDGTEASMFCQDLVVPDDPINFVRDITVTTGIDHNWVGDLVIKLISPDAKVLTLVSRPGLMEATDDGTGCCGKSGNVDPTSPLTFKDSAINPAEQMGTLGNLNTNQFVCQDDGVDPCEWSPSPGAGPGMNFSDFLGDAAAGNWRLCVGDGNNTDAGTLDSVKLVISRVKYDPMP